jgi:SAM-dependent methyltransferase
LFEASTKITETFDVVYTSWGVLCWLPDIGRWAELAAHFLKPGGMLYVADAHPVVYLFDDDRGAPPLRVAHTYFAADEPELFETITDYADPTATLEHTETYEWRHSLGGFVSAVCAAGLKIQFLHEHAFSTWLALPYLETKNGESWRMPAGMPEIPLSFSLAAIK